MSPALGPAPAARAAWDAPAQEAPGADPEVLPLDRKRIYILPTRHGLGFAGALLVMLVGALNYASSLGYLLTFLLGGVGLVSMLHTYRNLAGLKVRVGAPEGVFAGTEARVPVTIDNRGGPARHALLLHHPAALGRRGPEGAGRLRVAALAPDELRTWALPVELRARGVTPLAGLVIATRYPLGLFRGWCRLRPAASGLAYPAPAGAPGLPVTGGDEGAGTTRSGGGRDDFSGLREYQQGDSPKHIHWKAVARGQPPPVKLFEGAGVLALELAWEATAHLGDPEARLGQLAQWVLEAEREGIRYALRLPGEEIPLGGGREHRERCLRALALFPAPPASGEPA